MREVRVAWKAVRPGARGPVQHHEGDAGFDLFVYGDWTLLPGVLTNVPTGIAIAPEPGWWASIEHRSSTPLRGLEVKQGTIDNGFRGELLVRVINHNDGPVDLVAGERLAQVILHAVVPAVWEKVVDLPESDRGENGFGSTGQ